MGLFIYVKTIRCMPLLLNDDDSEMRPTQIFAYILETRNVDASY